MALQLESWIEGDGAMLLINGDVDEETVIDMHIAITNCTRETLENVILVNLSSVQSISYTEVGVLMERLRQLQGSSNDIKLVGMNAYTDRVFRMTIKAQAIYDFGQAA